MCLRFGQFWVVNQDHIEQRHCASCMCYSKVAVCATSDAEAEIAFFFLAGAVFMVRNGKWLCRNASFHKWKHGCQVVTLHKSSLRAGSGTPVPDHGGGTRFQFYPLQWGHGVAFHHCTTPSATFYKSSNALRAFKGMKRRHSTQGIMAQATDCSATLRFVTIIPASVYVLLSRLQEWAVSSHKCAQAKELVEGDACMQISL